MSANETSATITVSSLSRWAERNKHCGRGGDTPQASNGQILRWATATTTQGDAQHEPVASSTSDATSGTRSMPAFRSVVSVLVSFVRSRSATENRRSQALHRYDLRRPSSVALGSPTSSAFS
jgi:hypothetical protein